MDNHLSDRTLWLGFGFLAILAARGFRYAIKDTIRLTELDPNQSRKNKIDNELHPENSISVDTLRTLTTSPNPGISNAAISLVVSRFIQDPKEMRSLTRDAFSSNEETRRLARQAVRFLREYNGDLPSGVPVALSLPEWTSIPPQTAVSDTSERTDSHLSSRSRVLSRLEELNNETAIPPPFGSAPFAGWENVPSQRPETSIGVNETERRRRRREAMVLHEGGGDVVEDDIIRPHRPE